MRTLSAPSCHRPLEMRDAADDVDAHRERALEAVERAGAAQHAVLRKRDELQVEVRLHLLRTCSSASTASSRGSQTSTCERIASRPLATAQSQ